MLVPPLLSVVIPTHNRACYAVHAIASLLSLQADRHTLEIIVHDTSTDKQLSNWVADLDDTSQRLRYYHTEASLDQSQNHNEALKLATGKYVCLIGDDDTILPTAFDLAEYADRSDIDAIAPKIVANYAWPDFRSRIFGAKHGGRLYLEKRFGTSSRKDSALSLSAALQKSAQGTEGLPKLYHGLVKRSVLEQIFVRSGRYVHGTSPDVSAAIAIAAITQTFIELDYPITLPGASGGSNTGASAMGRHQGSLATTRQTARHAASWPTSIPAFYSVETVWAHAAIETLNALRHPAAKDFNYTRLYALCALKHPRDWRSIGMSIHLRYQQDPGSKLPFLLKGVAAALQIVLSEMSRLARRSLHPTAAGDRRYASSLSDIHQAQIEAIRLLQHNPQKLGKALSYSEHVN